LIDDDVCLYTLVPAQRTHGPEGGAGEFNVTATAGCRWTVTKPATANWLAVIIPSGTGVGNVTYTVDPNASTVARSAILKVAGKSFTILQRGVPPPDLTKPSLTILSPPAGARVTNLPLIVTGKSADAGGVNRVEFRVENSSGTNEYRTADGTTNWTATVDGLLPGLNVVRVRARDTADNVSTEITRTVRFVVVSPISLAIEGEGDASGVITGASDGQFLEVGRVYTITATAVPAKVNLFARWQGDIATNTARLTFTMRSNLSLRAVFVANPFIPLKGTYSGFATETALAPRNEASGFFTATITDLGAYSGKLTIGGKVISIAGRFDLEREATLDVARPGFNPLSITMSLAGETIHGSVSDRNWSANLLAERAATGGVLESPPAPGRYRFLFGGSDDPAQGPHGFSYGTATLDAAGKVTVVATLADGSVFSQRTALSQVPRFPMFARLYGGAGQLQAWMELPQDFFLTFGHGGNGLWLKSPVPTSRLYTNGFTLDIQPFVTRYLPTSVPSTPFLGMSGQVSYTGGHVIFSGGNLATPFTNVVRVDAGNKIVNLGTTDQGTNRLTLTYPLSSGLFSGTVTVPGTTRSIRFNGSLVGGYFLGTNEGGRVLLQAAP
jgi:hypothetical protein